MAFSRTLRALETDSPRLANGMMLAAAVLLGIWLIWFFRADLADRAVADLVLRAVGRSPAQVGPEPDFPAGRESLAAKDRHAD